MGTLKIGELAPGFSGLPGVDGKSRSLSDYEGAEVLVIVFSCNHCPYVQAYEDRLISIQKDFAPAGVQIVAINSNDSAGYPEDGFGEMVERSTAKKFPFDYLQDESQAVARAYGATHTPHLFVFDRSRRLRYTGKIDDNWRDPNAVTQTFLRDAIRELLSGRAPAKAETFAVGCTIKWKSG